MGSRCLFWTWSLFSRIPPPVPALLFFYAQGALVTEWETQCLSCAAFLPPQLYTAKNFLLFSDLLPSALPILSSNDILIIPTANGRTFPEGPLSTPSAPPFLISQAKDSPLLYLYILSSPEFPDHHLNDYTSLTVLQVLFPGRKTPFDRPLYPTSLPPSLPDPPPRLVNFGTHTPDSLPPPAPISIIFPDTTRAPRDFPATQNQRSFI